MHLRSLIAHSAGHRRRLALLALLTTASSLIMLAIPWLGGQLIGGIVSGKTAAAGWALAILLACLTLIAAFGYVTAYVSAATSSRLLADLRQRLYVHLQALPLGFHENRRQGDTLALMTFEIMRLSTFLSGTLTNVPARLLTAAGAAVMMLSIDSRLALLVPLLIPAFYLILKLAGRRLRSLAEAMQQAEADVVALAEENLEMLPAIKAFAREEVEADHYRDKVDRAMRLTVRQGRIYAALEPLIGLTASIATVIVLYLAGRSVQSGSMTAAELFAFIFYAALLTRPVSTLAHLYGEVQTARGTLARLQTILDEPIERGYAAPAIAAPARGAIAFDNVCFGYAGRDPVIRHLDLVIQPGETVALVGDNGAGKTTLIKLLLRFYDPTSGTISLDGRDIAGLQVQDLRRQIGFVPQRVLMFGGSIRDNIVYGSPGATQAQIEAAARLAQAYDFVSHLPQGFDTEIGDHGVRLSGGQQQRIALARALLKDPPILILDEATSMFDHHGEGAFIEACAGALKGRTVILITHRPATLALADRIVRVEDGQVREVAPATATAPTPPTLRLAEA